MIKCGLTFICFLSAILITIPVNAQNRKYADQCHIARDLLDSANASFYNFSRMSSDSTITILDINNVLTDCLIDSIGRFRIIVVNSGEDVEKIRKKGIFNASRKRKDVFVFTKELLNNMTGFRLYHPTSSGSCYWGFIKKKNRFHFKEKSYGWF